MAQLLAFGRKAFARLEVFPAEHAVWWARFERVAGFVIEFERERRIHLRKVVAETGGRLGLITPLTHNFCESCNRVRITCTGTLYMCLGQEDAADLRGPLRASESDNLVHAAIDEAITRKPRGHDFVIDRRRHRPALSRHMSVTGG
ncbi:MAG: hypothetical protein B7Y77_01080 [Bradyrhizobium sp. 35-63-5]|nr:MAG: hypothetical protein B7Y77_01080 [Bradyrhizobium sp. 35-63-5]